MPDKQNYPIKSTVPFKLKDKNDRWKIVFDLKEQFGFLPEKIVIAKLKGKNNTLVMGAFLTPEEIKKNQVKEVIKAKPIK
jgi:hypothetical protein